MFNYPSRPDLAMNERVLDAELWSHTDPFEADLLAPRNHGLDLLRITFDANETLDRKAEWMFVVAGGAFGGLLAYPEKLGLDFWSALIPMAAFLWAMWLAVVGRAPCARILPMSTREAVEQVRRNPRLYDYWMCASLHHATVQNEEMNGFKSRMVHYSERTVVVGAILTAVVAAFSRLAP